MTDHIPTGVEPRPPKRLKIDLGELALALEDNSGMLHWWLDTETGELVFVSEFEPSETEEIAEAIDGDTEGRFLSIDSIASHVGFEEMEEWTETVADPILQEALWEALRRNRPFRRFKDVLLDWPRERDAWFAFKNERDLERARAWLAENGIELMSKSDAPD